MNAKEKEVFRKLHDELSGCDPKYFVAKLIQSGILSQEDYEVYLQRSTPREKMNEICQIIQRKGILHPFMKALDETGDYDFIVDKYKKLTSQLGITCEDKLSVDDNEEILSGVLRLGGVPNLPAKLLPRQNEVFKVQGGILGMHDDDAILPVYCMAGGGKSVIVNQALRSQKLFNKIFNQGVYWVTVGKIEPDALLTKMQQLCVRMNVDKQPSSCEIAMEYLRKAFNRPEHRQTLVILDDVWSSDILRYFDVGCRLIVITKDLSVVDPFTRRNEPIEVNPFLTEAESIELFSLHLGIPIMEPDLSKAKDIHKEACGSPMMIYMIGDLLAKSRNRKSGTDNWSRYAKALADRKQLSVKHTTDYQFSNPLDAIAMSFETLPREDQERFRWFAVFMRDVNIPAKVLATLWDIDTIDVEDYMYIYIKSTIAREMWDQATEQFIYGIHDFVLEYLKREVPTEEVKVLHRKIIERYQEGHRPYYEFPDDNYIYYFIGYHLDRSGETELFPDVYLDIRFIAAKLRATGPGDLLNDMCKYERYISGNGNESSYQDFLIFIKHHGSYIAVHPKVDVIQLALLEPIKSAVYKNAVEIAHLDPDNYYEWCNREGGNDSHCKYLVSTMTAGNVTAVLLTRDERRVLVAISSGPIKLIDTKSSRVIYTFTGHLDSVNHLALSPDGCRFVSASKDRTCMVWDLEKVLKEADGINNENSESLRPNKTPSPRSRQDSHFKMFNKDDNERDPCLLAIYPQSLQVENPNTSTEDALDSSVDHLGSTDEADGVQLKISGDYETDSKITVPSDIVLDVSTLSLSNNSAQYTWAEFSNSGTFIACTISSTCCLWSSIDGTHFKDFPFDDEVGCCTFSPSDSLLAVASIEEISLFKTDDWSSCILRSFNTRHLRFIDDTKLVSVSVSGAELWDCTPGNHWTELNSMTCLFRAEKVKTSAIHNQGHRLAFADEKNMVRIFDIQSRKFTGDRRCRSGKIICLAFGLKHYVLAGTEDCMLVIWEMETEPISDVLPGGYEMDARWTSDNPESLEIAVVSRQGIEVRRGLTTSEAVAACSEEDSSIIACAFTASSKNVAWATESNQIKMMSLTSGEVATVGSHVGSMINIMKFGPKGKVLATVGKDGTMMLWTRAKDKDQESRGSPCFVGRRIDIPRLEVFQFYFVSHSTDGSSIWSCGSNKKDDLSVLVVHSEGTAKVWLCASGKLVDTKCSNLALSLTACDISSCNMYLAIGDETSGLRQFRLQEPKISISLATHANKDMVVSACRYSPDVNFHYLAVGYNSGAFELWDFADGKLLHILNYHSSAVKDILFAASNPKIIVSISDRIALWNLAESGRKKPKTYNKKSWSPMPEVKTFEFNSCILPVQTVELPCTGTTIKIRGNADLSTLVAMTDLGSIYKLKRL